MNSLMGMIEDVKQKLTDSEYMSMMSELKIINTQLTIDQEMYKIKIYYPKTYSRHFNMSEDDDDEDGICTKFFNSIEHIEIKSKIKKCNCHLCSHNGQKCLNEKFLAGELTRMNLCQLREILDYDLNLILGDDKQDVNHEVIERGKVISVTCSFHVIFAQKIKI